MEEWRYFGTHSGHRKGESIPYTSQCFLHELDEFMKIKIKEFSNGGRRKPNPEYKRALQNRANRIKWIRQGFGASGYPADEQKIAKWEMKSKP